MSEQVSELFVVTDGHKQRTKAQVDENLAAQVAKLLERHGNDLPSALVIMLKSPFPHVVVEGQRACKEWLRKHVEECAAKTPEFEEVRALLAEINFILTGELGKDVTKKLNYRIIELLATPPTRIVLMQDGLKQVRDAASLVKRLEGQVRNSEPKVGAKKPSRQAPILHPIITVTGERRERRPKPSKPAVTSLPPVHSIPNPREGLELIPEFRYGIDDKSPTEGKDRSQGGNRRSKPSGKKGGKK